MGHISRTLKIANILKKNGHNCFFYIDKIKNIQKIKINFPIYQMGKNYNYNGEINDAKIFIKLIKEKKACVILDDYRLKNNWKKIIKKEKVKLICISDEIEVEKYADYLINYKVNSYLIPRLKNYKKNKTKYLLGPNYALIDQEKSFQNYDYKKFNIVIYLGGSGDVNLFEGISNAIKKKFIQNKYKDFNIKIILGPLIKNKEKIISRYKNSRYINTITNEYNLNNIYKKSQLFIGSSGTSIYETNYAKIPTILFKYVDNQDDKISDLELMGHYFNLKKIEIFKFNKIADFTFLIFKNYSRIKKITSAREISIDNLGAKRIYKAIFNNKIINYKSRNSQLSKNKNTFFKATDIDINNVVQLRNEKHNRYASLNKNIISNLDHYIWWFKSQNNMYLIKKDYSLKMVFLNKFINRK